MQLFVAVVGKQNFIIDQINFSLEKNEDTFQKQWINEFQEIHLFSNITFESLNIVT